MRICFLGRTHLTFCTSVAAARRGFIPVPKEEIDSAELIFVAWDVYTDANGKRYYGLDLAGTINELEYRMKPIILMSQVAPGFCRDRYDHLYYQPETLRILDATDRAYAPECIIVGCSDPARHLPMSYQNYLDAFQCPIIKTSYETAEFSKIAINMYLASQVDTTNRLSEAAKKVGADWDALRLAIGYDSRIGKYLTPGRWQDSIHLLRDYVTLKEIEDAR
jgi:UDPglucose 6-dehydrogenase